MTQSRCRIVLAALLLAGSSAVACPSPNCATDVLAGSGALLVGSGVPTALVLLIGDAVRDLRGRRTTRPHAISEIVLGSVTAAGGIVVLGGLLIPNHGDTSGDLYVAMLGAGTLGIATALIARGARILRSTDSNRVAWTIMPWATMSNATSTGLMAMGRF
jgi:hypothetical protein